MTTLYLNNSGDRWIVVDQNYSRAPMDFILVLEDGSLKKRRADYYAQFGNFATVEFRISGKRYGGFFDSFAKIDGLPVLRRYNKRGELSAIDTTEVLTDTDLELLGAYK